MTGVKLMWQSLRPTAYGRAKDMPGIPVTSQTGRRPAKAYTTHCIYGVFYILRIGQATFGHPDYGKEKPSGVGHISTVG